MGQDHGGLGPLGGAPRADGPELLRQVVILVQALEKHQDYYAEMQELAQRAGLTETAAGFAVLIADLDGLIQGVVDELKPTPMGSG